MAESRKCALAGCPVIIQIGTQNKHQKYHAEKCRVADKKPWTKPARKAYMRDYMRSYGKRARRAETGVVPSALEDSMPRMPLAADEQAARELELFIENDRQLFEGMFKPIVKNLANRMAKGEYEREKAVKAFRYLIDEGSKRYLKEFGGPGYNRYVFSPATRDAVARSFEQGFRSEWDAGSYRDELTKVARKAMGQEPALYTSTYCNRAHRLDTGRPVGHECRIIPPAALAAERNGDMRRAIEIIEKAPVTIVRGR